jgi:hypothetical protein
MKKMKIYLEVLFFIIGLFGVSIYINSQDIKPDKKSRKEARQAQMTTNYYVLDSVLHSMRFVLEADFLQGKYGDRVLVPSTLNFIRVDGPKGVLQTGSDTRQGYNGVGGVTAEGNLEDYRITNDKKNLTTTATFNLLTNLGTFDIFLRVSADNNANATISGTTSGKLTWVGHLVTLDNSRAFKGFTTY